MQSVIVYCRRVLTCRPSDRDYVAMLLRGLESPISSIIQQGSRLGLTPEQQQQLRRIELDLVSDVTRLLSERDLLEIEAQKENLSKNLEARAC